MTIRSTPAKAAITALCLAASGAWATEYGTVLSSRPVVATVPVGERQCFDEPVEYQQPRSGGGALLGAIAGAALGNTLGHGVERAAATGIGMVAGAAIGDRIEADGSRTVASTAQRCRTVTRYENRTVGYDVEYEYQGVHRSVRLDRDPGDRIALDVSVAPVGAQGSARMAPVPPARVYRAPADVPYEAYDRDEPYGYDEPLPPRVVYAPRPYVYVNPVPYIVIRGDWYGGGGRGGWRGHGR